jgi:hypothetical protein
MFRPISKSHYDRQSVGQSVLVSGAHLLQLQLQLIYDRQSVGRSVLVSGAHLGPVTCNQFFVLLEISFRQLRVCTFVAPSVRLLLGLARAVTLWSKSHRTRAIFYCLIRDSTNLEGQVPVFRSHVNVARNFQCYHWEGCMGSMQCNVEFGYQLSICSETKVNHGKPWSNWPVAGPSECKLTSSQQSGMNSANPNISPYSLQL